VAKDVATRSRSPEEGLSPGPDSDPLRVPRARYENTNTRRTPDTNVQDDIKLPALGFPCCAALT